MSGSEYDVEEAIKVKRYFKGPILLKNYFFWEKIISIWVVREDYDALYDSINSISKQIELLSFKIDKNFRVSGNNLLEFQTKTKNDLRRYFNVAVRMAMGLFPAIANLATTNDNTVLKSLKDIELYRETWLLRKNLIFFPLIQFSTYAKSHGFPLYNKRIMDDLLKNGSDLFKLTSAFYPYRVKLNECCQYSFLKWLYKAGSTKSNESKKFTDFFNCQKFLNEAFDLFCKTNSIDQEDKEHVKNEYFVFTELNKNIKCSKSPKGIKVRPIKIPNSDPKKGDLRVCLVNKYVDFKESERSLDGNPVSDIKRFEDFNRILDDIKKIKDADVFIMPEICLPYHFIPHMILYSVNNQTAFITGVEHWTVGKFVFNYVLTSLPLKVEGDNDAIVIPRLKNHYAPEEEKIIADQKKLKIPKPQPYNYELILWRGTYFSIYYCFESADVKHRNLLLGLVDVLFAPVWNKDIHYYNSLVESASRDMHCFIVLANTTQYGDSRITRPAEYIRRDKLRIKGGTISDHKAIILVSDLEISKLREFQIGSNKKLKEINEKKEEAVKFKPLPPDFPINCAELRNTLSLFESDNNLNFMDREYTASDSLPF